MVIMHLYFDNRTQTIAPKTDLLKSRGLIRYK